MCAFFNVLNLLCFNIIYVIYFPYTSRTVAYNLIPDAETTLAEI